LLEFKELTKGTQVEKLINKEKLEKKIEKLTKQMLKL